MKETKDELLALVREGAGPMTLRQKLRLTVLLSLPAMVAQISSVIMQYIDASMLGRLGANEAASVGLVSTTIWLFGGLVSAFASGFSVQIAHHIGGNDSKGARSVVRQGITSALCFSLLLTIIGMSIAPHLPHWLGAGEEICDDASEYFAIFAAALPFLQLNLLAAGSLRCSGNIKVPSMLGVMMCVLDVIFNYIFIFMLHMGTAGAAYGTFAAEVVSMTGMLYFLIVKDKNLKFALDSDLSMLDMRQHLKAYLPTRMSLLKAFKIGSPISLERGVMCGAQIAITSIVAPLGAVSIAANSFGITAESLCYMPGYGVAEAATTLVGQSVGAKRHDLMKSFAYIALWVGMAIMTMMGVLMYFGSDLMMEIMTTDKAIISLGSEVLKIEAWAEPMFAAAIVVYSVYVGTGKTLIPSIMNLASIWVVRLSLALLLAPTFGLVGVWIAMCAELCWRGAAFIFKMWRDFRHY